MDDDGLPSVEEFLIDFSDLVFGPRIGRGQYGNVYKGEYLGTSVAIKQCVFEGQDQEMTQKYISREISILREVRHPNIVNFIGLCKRQGISPRKSKEAVFLVTEWVPNGNLNSYLRNPENKLSWEHRVNMAIDIAASMAFLHRKNLLHRDLKSDNILIAENGRMKLCDFGFARTRVRGRLMTMAGTEEYMAPEMTLGEDYGEKVDVFGFGVVLLEMVSRKPPPKRSPVTCFEFRSEDLAAVFPPECPPQLEELARKCVEYRPEDRPSFPDALHTLKELREQITGQLDISKLSTFKDDEDDDDKDNDNKMKDEEEEEERTAEEREDERGPEINFDEDEDQRTEGEREDERGPEICFDADEHDAQKEEDGDEVDLHRWRKALTDQWTTHGPGGGEGGAAIGRGRG